MARSRHTHHNTVMNSFFISTIPIAQANASCRVLYIARSEKLLVVVSLSHVIMVFITIQKIRGQNIALALRCVQRPERCIDDLEPMRILVSYEKVDGILGF
jgi:hypothetical protein